MSPRFLYIIHFIFLITQIIQQRHCVILQAPLRLPLPQCEYGGDYPFISSPFPLIQHDSFSEVRQSAMGMSLGHTFIAHLGEISQGRYRTCLI